MSQSADDTHSVVIEKTFPHPPEKLWRAMTDSTLLTQWLLRNDFQPEIGREFKFQNEPVTGWDGVIDCKVLVIERPIRISYSWRAFGLDSTVEFTLTSVEGGTRLRMEHSGFRSDQGAAYQGAHHGWQKFLSNLEQVLNKEAS